MAFEATTRFRAVGPQMPRHPLLAVTATVDLAPADLSCAKIPGPANQAGGGAVKMMIDDQVELPYLVDPQRHGRKRATGIEVQAVWPSGEPVTVDIAELDRYSLKRWARSRTNDNFLTHAVTLLLFEHENTIPRIK